MKSDPIHKITTPTLFVIFLKLGCISFGGPAAHLVLFHRTFVDQLKWLTSHEYGQIVALAQLLPGPTSSQVGISIGYLSKGYWGGFVAWLAFTLPAFMIMTLVAIFGQNYFSKLPLDLFHVIHLIVLAVVIWAFWQMLQNFCKETWQYLLMLVSAAFIYFSSFSFAQIIVILFAAIVGVIASTKKKSKINKQIEPTINHLFPLKKDKAYRWIILFFLPFLLFALIKHFHPSSMAESLASFYQSASMVFGGGHIILPLMHQEFVSTGLIPAEQFDLGYALAQLIPGPLFSFASYLGGLLNFTDSSFLNAIIATVMIFLPSFLLIFGTLPYWSKLMKIKKINQAVNGINAAVIGLLLCLIFQMGEKNLTHYFDFIFVGCVVLLLKSKLPVWISLIGSFFAYSLLLLN